MPYESFPIQPAGALTPVPPQRKEKGVAKRKPNSSQRRSHRRTLARAEAAWQQEVKDGKAFGAAATPIYQTTRVNGKKVRKIVDHLIPPIPESRLPRLADSPRKPSRNYASKSKAKPVPDPVPESVGSKSKRPSGAARRKKAKAKRAAQVTEPTPSTSKVVDKTYAEVAAKPKVQGKPLEHEHPWLAEKGARYCVVVGCSKHIKPDVLVKYSPVKVNLKPKEKATAKVVADKQHVSLEDLVKQIDEQLRLITEFANDVDADLSADITGPVDYSHHLHREESERSGAVSVVTGIKPGKSKIPLLTNKSTVISKVREVQQQVPPKQTIPKVVEGLSSVLPQLAIEDVRPAVSSALVPYNGGVVANQIEAAIDLRTAQVVARTTRDLSPVSSNVVREMVNTGIPMPPLIGDIYDEFDTEQPVPSNHRVVTDSDALSVVTFDGPDTSINVVFPRNTRKGRRVYTKGILGIDRDLYYYAQTKRIYTGKTVGDGRYLKTQLTNWIEENKKNWTTEERFRQLAKVITATTVGGQFEDMQRGFLKKTKVVKQVHKDHKLNTSGHLGTRRAWTRLWKKKSYDLPSVSAI
uniref:Uncharacterized protein n=1 Tax=Golovinomyces cichoracearum associated tombus-like virus 1 TaxID=2754854 RepID=A0A7D6EQV6_9TOMB|nr:hypothetical protein [Golovinomyces cichoracearum associated tombus-like virus 1]